MFLSLPNYRPLFWKVSKSRNTGIPFLIVVQELIFRVIGRKHRQRIHLDDFPHAAPKLCKVFRTFLPCRSFFHNNVDANGKISSSMATGYPAATISGQTVR